MTDAPQAVGLSIGQAVAPRVASRFNRAFFARTPVHLWLLALVLAPNLLLLVTSFMQSSGGAVIWEPSLKNYTALLTSFTVQFLAFKTLVVALAAAVIATAIA